MGQFTANSRKLSPSYLPNKKDAIKKQKFFVKTKVSGMQKNSKIISYSKKIGQNYQTSSNKVKNFEESVQSSGYKKKNNSSLIILSGTKTHKSKKNRSHLLQCLNNQNQHKLGNYLSQY